MKGLKVGVIRYADDFVVTGAGKQFLEDEVKPWIEQFLAVRGLRLAGSKTKVVHIDEGFDFLGWNFRKYSGTLLIKPARKNVKAFYEKVRSIIGNNLALKQEGLVHLLNPVLRGWAQYHSRVVAKKTFSSLDRLIFWRLMRWAKRRHPRKNAEWIKQKYWHSVGERNWVFAAVASEGGQGKLKELCELASTPIERHKKVKGMYHPYDPSWEMYGETLTQERMVNQMRYRREWVKLYVDQQGKCALCGNMMDIDTGWHDHHIDYRVNGGSDALGNRVLLHPVCHHRVHQLGMTVVKPVFE